MGGGGRQKDILLYTCCKPRRHFHRCSGPGEPKRMYFNMFSGSWGGRMHALSHDAQIQHRTTYHIKFSSKQTGTDSTTTHNATKFDANRRTKRNTSQNSNVLKTAQDNTRQRNTPQQNAQQARFAKHTTQHSAT